MEPSTGKFIRFFIDESGTPDRYIKGTHTPSERFFTLCAIAIEEGEYRAFKKKIAALHATHKRYINGKEIKSRSIRRSNPKGIDQNDPPEYDFWKYKDGHEKYEAFCTELKGIIETTRFVALSVTVDKAFAQKNYPSEDVLTTALNDLWERICIYKTITKYKKSRIIFDPTHNVNDEAIHSTYKDFIAQGTNFVDMNYINNAQLHPIAYSPDSKESYGLQLADIFAYPIRAFHERGTSDYYERNVAPKLFPYPVLDPITNKSVHLSLKMTLSK